MLLSDPDTRAVARTMMLEGRAVAEKLGARMAIDVDRRIEGGRWISSAKLSSTA